MEDGHIRGAGCYAIVEGCLRRFIPLRNNAKHFEHAQLGRVYDRK